MACEPYAIAATREDCSRSLSRECSRRGDRVIRNSSNSTKRPPHDLVRWTRRTSRDAAIRPSSRPLLYLSPLIEEPESRVPALIRPITIREEKRWRGARDDSTSSSSTSTSTLSHGPSACPRRALRSKLFYLSRSLIYLSSS